MTPLSLGEWSLPGWAALCLLGAAVLLVLLALTAALLESRGRRRLQRSLSAAEQATEELRARLDALERRTQEAGAGVVREEREYVITSIGEAGTPLPAETVTLTAPAFADAVMRESVVHTASFLHGLRRALSPEVRNRIRFEMKREVKRSRKERRFEVKEALREYRARHRADVPADDGVAV